MSTEDRLISAAVGPWRIDRDGWKARAERAESALEGLQGRYEEAVKLAQSLIDFDAEAGSDEFAEGWWAGLLDMARAFLSENRNPE